MLLIHGRTWSARPVWDLQVPGRNGAEFLGTSTMDLMAAEGFRTFAPDFRGMGGTPRDEPGWTTPDRCVADMAAVLDYLEVAEGVKRPHVIGWYQVRITRCHRACDWMWAVMLGGGVVALDRGRLLRSCWPSRTARNWTASYFTAQFTTPAS